MDNAYITYILKPLKTSQVASLETTVNCGTTESHNMKTFDCLLS